MQGSWALLSLAGSEGCVILTWRLASCAAGCSGLGRSSAAGSSVTFEAMPRRIRSTAASLLSFAPADPSSSPSPSPRPSP